MARRTPRRERWRRAAFSALGWLAAAPLRVLARVLPALPERAALALADVVGWTIYALDRRGRRAGRANLRAVFGDELSDRARRRILRASYVNSIQAEVLLFHVQPMTPARWARYVRVPDDAAERGRRAAEAGRPIVFVSAHFGNWEMLHASRGASPFRMASDYLAETTGWPAVDELFERLREHGGRGQASLRKGGATALTAGLRQGRSVGLLADRNVPRRFGGVFVPFLGLPARTTPLPAKLAHWHGAPLVALLLIPEARARWRFWSSGDLMEPRTGDEDVDIAAATARMNDVFSRVIREHPEAWCWMMKRWKSRPTPELGPYPSYSLVDPE
jgi:KDO2-lipid IV(A) lauroyltransferase